MIAPDAGLREALTFALEVEDFRVDAFENWQDDLDTLSTYLCLVVDDQIVRANAGSCEFICRPTTRAIVLADGLTPPPCEGRAQVLTKPLDGPELVQRVQELLIAS